MNDHSLGKNGSYYLDLLSEDGKYGVIYDKEHEQIRYVPLKDLEGSKKGKQHLQSQFNVWASQNSITKHKEGGIIRKYQGGGEFGGYFNIEDVLENAQWRDDVRLAGNTNLEYSVNGVPTIRRESKANTVDSYYGSEGTVDDSEESKFYKKWVTQLTNKNNAAMAKKWAESYLNWWANEDNKKKYDPKGNIYDYWKKAWYDGEEFNFDKFVSTFSKNNINKLWNDSKLGPGHDIFGRIVYYYDNNGKSEYFSSLDGLDKRLTLNDTDDNWIWDEDNWVWKRALSLVPPAPDKTLTIGDKTYTEKDGKWYDGQGQEVTITGDSGKETVTPVIKEPVLSDQTPPPVGAVSPYKKGLDYWWPDLLGKTAGYIRNNIGNKKEYEARKNYDPWYSSTYELYRPVVGDFASRKFYDKQAADVMNWASQARTSDASLNTAMQLDAMKRATELREKGFLADNKRISETMDEALKLNWGNIQRRTENTNNNRQRLYDYYKEMANLRGNYIQKQTLGDNNFLQTLGHDISSILYNNNKKKEDFYSTIYNADIQDWYNRAYREVMDYKASKGDDYWKDTTNYRNLNNYLAYLQEIKTMKALRAQAQLEGRQFDWNDDWVANLNYEGFINNTFNDNLLQMNRLLQDYNKKKKNK